MGVKTTNGEITEVLLGEDRYYESKGWCYPSVTTILNKRPEQQYASDGWKRHLIATGLGEEEAEAQMQQVRNAGAKRGTAVHTLCERYLLEGREPCTVNSNETFLFNLAKPELDKINLARVGDSALIEEIVYSEKLGIAGRVDMCGTYEGELCIIDIKTSEKLKPKQQRESWFLQTCAYALCIFEMYDILPETLLIINPAEDNKLRIYKESMYDWTIKLQQAIDHYREYYE